MLGKWPRLGRPARLRQGLLYILLQAAQRLTMTNADPQDIRRAFSKITDLASLQVKAAILCRDRRHSPADFRYLTVAYLSEEFKRKMYQLRPYPLNVGPAELDPALQLFLQLRQSCPNLLTDVYRYE
jgi:hypothetical protein